MLKNTPFEELIVSANAEALLELSDRYQKGIGGAERSDVKAYEYAHKAFEAGNFDALARIADYYAKGKGGLKRSEEHARDLLAEGEKENSARCFQRLAHFYKNGECGYPKDENKAIEYCTKIVGTETEDANVKGYAYTCLGSVYEEGKLGAPRNLKKALTFYQKAAKIGYAFAYVLLGNQKRFLYLQEISSLSRYADTRTAEDKQKCKQRADKLMDDIHDAQILYRQAIEIAEQDADAPVIEGAKNYLALTEDDTRSLITFEKRLNLIDSEPGDDLPAGFSNGYTISFPEGSAAETPASLNVASAPAPSYGETPYVAPEHYESEEPNCEAEQPVNKSKRPLWARVFGFALFCAAVGLIVALILTKVMNG